MILEYQSTGKDTPGTLYVFNTDAIIHAYTAFVTNAFRAAGVRRERLPPSTSILAKSRLRERSWDPYSVPRIVSSIEGTRSKTSRILLEIKLLRGMEVEVPRPQVGSVPLRCFRNLFQGPK